MRAHEMVDEGADIVDVGGESTRPGAEPVSTAEELRRVIPVIEALAGQVRVSIDTTKDAVADAAVHAGASMINDVSASLWPVAARHRVGWVAMHRQGSPATMQARPHYDDVVGEVSGMLVERAARARAGRGGRGLDRSRHRLRQDHRSQPGAARLAGRSGGHRLSGHGRDQPQELPGLVGVVGRLVRPGGRAASGVVGHGHLGHGPGRPDGAGPRCGRHRPGRRAGGTGGVRRRDSGAGDSRPGDRGPQHRKAGRVAPVPRRMQEIRRSERERKVGGGDPASQLHLGDQGPHGHERAAGRLRPQPPQGATPGGDHLAAGPGVHPGDLAAAVVPQSAGLRGALDGQRALPPAVLG